MVLSDADILNKLSPFFTGAIFIIKPSNARVSPAALLHLAVSVVGYIIIFAASFYMFMKGQ